MGAAAAYQSSVGSRMLFVTGYADNANNWFSWGLKKTMVEYDVGTDAWAPRTDFPKALIGLNAVVHDNLM